MSEKKEILEESKKLIEKYKLLPFSEGGYFAEIYTSSSSSLIQNNNRPLAGSIYFLLEQKDFATLTETRNLILHKRIEKQPLDLPSAGSVFKRPVGDYASRLIDEAGLRGLSIGGAKVSEKHAGFIVNFNRATPQDIKALMDRVRSEVKAKFGVELELEQILWGQFNPPPDA